MLSLLLGLMAFLDRGLVSILLLGAGVGMEGIQRSSSQALLLLPADQKEYPRPVASGQDSHLPTLTSGFFIF
ncbi:MAG: hypothetical protein COT91_01555 [Candidatus Doudnabacteria bacterium CG10_big_fil_rev_8_21_14_0_10_41_10]|uniref:Uncharacterized protein n=1 Tax=Candidatus Doudnabacteria bacterium CG10_big_fil_rev_8_21_14_0_10_41_10 TaxID=1974551 RepID=A0A2H0VE83_9BACT|nr:MAG: hypothetical protein COT91_01555 [Candidatus Doudnabacteria bacterium CG10_big_fil_rev_8_21_14_0_10_41_10]